MFRFDDGLDSHCRLRDDDIKAQADQFLRLTLSPLGIAPKPSKVKPDIPPVDPSELAKFFSESGNTRRSLSIALGSGEQHAHLSHLGRLLRARGERPGSCRAP
jgi:hypothetical protein